MELLQTLDLAAVGRSFGFAVPPHIDLGVGYRLDHYLILVLFPFFAKKIIYLLGGQINDPSSEKQYSLLFLPATPSSPSRTLEELFELTRSPSRALDSPRALLPELQRYKDTVRCAELGAEVPGHHQQQLMQTLIVRLLKTHLHRSLMVKKSKE